MNSFDNLKKDSQSLIDDGKLEDAAEVLEQIVLILEKPETANLDEMIAALESLGACYFGMQDYEKTVSVYSRLVVNLDEKVGMDHIETIKAVYKLAKSCEKAGQREQAQTMYYVAKDSANKTLPDGHYLRQSINESYHAIARPKRVVESVNTFVVGDLQDPKELVKAAKSLVPMLRRMSTKMGAIVSITCTIALIAASGAWITFEAMKRKSVATQAQSIEFVARDARTAPNENTFSTTDRLLVLRLFNDKEGEFECDGKAVKVPVVMLSDSFDSFIKMYDRGGFDRRIWAEYKSEGISVNGVQLFNAGSMPLKLADACNEVVAKLNDFYRKNRSYPDAKAEIIANGRLTYTNPLTGKPQPASYQNFSQYMQLSHLFDGAKTDEEVVDFLRSGGHWADEGIMVAGDIHCVSRYTGEKQGENFIIPTAYLRVAGQDKELLPGSIAGEVMVVVLEKGETASQTIDLPRVRDAVLKSVEGRTLYFVKSQGLFTGTWLYKNVTTVILALAFLSSVAWWFIFDARARLEQRAKPPKASEIVVCVSGLIFVAWVIVAAIIQR